MPYIINSHDPETCPECAAMREREALSVPPDDGVSPAFEWETDLMGNERTVRPNRAFQERLTPECYICHSHVSYRLQMYYNLPALPDFPDMPSRVRLCLDCHDSRYDYCYECDGDFSRNEDRCPTHRVIYDCRHCNRYNGQQRFGLDYRVCEECLNLHYWQCGDCNRNVSNDYEECRFCEENHDSDIFHTSDCYCRQCERNRRDARNLIHSYSYKPRPQFRGEGPVYLGFELEVAVPTGRTLQAVELAVARLSDLAYLKEDGSVPGFEIVSHPMSYDWAVVNNGYPWPMLAELSDLGASAEDSCGLHVHVSRRGFSDHKHAYRWMKFFYRNAQYVQGIARRYNSGYARFGSENLNENPMRKCSLQWAKGAQEAVYTRVWVPARTRESWDGWHYVTQTTPGHWEDRTFYAERYSAINVQNSDTYEVRVFASSLQQNEVKAALGLVDASVEYTRNLTVSDILHNDGWSAQSFQKWLKAESGRTEKYNALVTETDRVLQTN